MKLNYNNFNLFIYDIYIINMSKELMDNIHNRNNTLLKNNSSSNVNMRKVIIYLLIKQMKFFIE
jgi:hypothetical protein